MKITMENESLITMLDFYFSEIKYNNNKRTPETTKINCKNRVEYQFDETDKTLVTVKINTELNSDNNSINLSVSAVGVFSIPLGLEARDYICKANTVAIMFPFVRSEITLLTAQPGLMPIMLPPVDVNALIKDQK
jgi:preprotein translocase subunit secB